MLSSLLIYFLTYISTASRIDPFHFLSDLQLLNSLTLRRTCCNARRTAASAEQPGQSGLSEQRPDRRQTTPQVAPLAACQAASHLQDGDDDVQGHDVIDACIPERPDPDNCSGSASAIIRRPTADCSQSAN